MKSSGLVQSRMARPALTQPGLAPKVDPDVWADSPWGMNDFNFGTSTTPGVPSDTLYAMREAGITWVRIMINWSNIEATQGTYVWDSGANNLIDTYHTLVKAFGFKILASIFNAPNWAKATPSWLSGTVTFDSVGKTITAITPASGFTGINAGMQILVSGAVDSASNGIKHVTINSSDTVITIGTLADSETNDAGVTILTSNFPVAATYATFVTAYMNRFAGKVDAVQILSEESTANTITPDRDPKKYLPVLIAGYNAVKAAQPTCPVVLGAMWTNPPAWLQDLYSVGGQNYFDHVAVHPYYTSGIHPDGVTAANTLVTVKPFNWYIRHLRKLMNSYGDFGKEIWVTECNWTVTSEGQTVTAVTQAQQVAWMEYLARSAMQGDVAKIFPYIMQDDTGMCFEHATDNFSWSTAPPTIGTANMLIGDTSLIMTSWAAGRWPAGGGVVKIEDEEVLYTGITTTTLTGLTRAYNGTTAAQHDIGVSVRLREQQAGYRNALYDNWQILSRAFPKWRRGQRVNPPDIVPPGPPLALLNGDMALNSGGVVTSWGANAAYDDTRGRPGSPTGVHCAAVTSAAGAMTRAAQAISGLIENVGYLVSGWVMSSNPLMTIKVTIDIKSGGTFRAEIAGSDQYRLGTLNDGWQYFAFPFTTIRGDTDWTALDNIIIYLVAGGTSLTAPGTAYFDDISISPLAL